MTNDYKIILIASAVAGVVIIILAWWIGYVMGRTAQMEEDRDGAKNFPES